MESELYFFFYIIRHYSHTWGINCSENLWDQQSTWTVKSTQKNQSSIKGKYEQTGVIPPIYISIYIPHMWFTNLTQCKVSTELPSCILTPFNPFKDSWIILTEQISSSTTILVQNSLWNNRFHFSIFFGVKSTWNNHFSIDFGANWNNHFHFSILCCANPLKL